MADYSISLGALISPEGLQRIRSQIETLENNPVTLRVDTSQAQTQINNIRQQIQQLGNIRINLGGVGAGGSNINSGVSNTQNAVNQLTTAYKKLINISKNIGSIKIKLNGLDTSQDINQIKVLEGQLQSLTNQYHTTVAKIKGKGDLPSEQWQRIQQQIDNTKIKLDQLSGKISDTKAKLASNIQGNFGNYDVELIRLEGRFNNLTNQTPQLKTGIESVRQALATLKSADDTDAIINANERYKLVLQQVKAELNQVAAAEKNQNSSLALQQQRQQLAAQMNSWLRENSAAASQFGAKIRELQLQLKNCGNTTGLKQVRDQFKTVTAQAQEAGVATLSFGDRIKKQFSQYTSYFSVYMVFMYAIQAMRSMFEQVKEIDSAMTELKKVTDETDASYNRFLTNAASRATEIGTTISGLVDSTADFARLGYSFEDAQGLAEVANIYAVVGDEIEGVDQATESLISTMAAFKDEASEMSNTDFAMSIIDKFNEVGKLIA